MNFEAITVRSHNLPSQELINVFKENYANDELLATYYNVPYILIGSIATFTGRSDKYNKILGDVP